MQPNTNTNQFIGHIKSRPILLNKYSIFYYSMSHLPVFMDIYNTNLNIMRSSGSFYRSNSPITHLATFPQIILQTLELVLAKLIQMTTQLQSMAPSTPPLPHSNRSSLINIHERKNLPVLRKSDSNMSNLRNDFEGILGKLTEFKNSSSFDKKILDSSPQAHNSFEYEEMEINLVKVEEDLKKEIGEVRVRLTTVEDDIGQILLLYKDLIFDK